MSNPFANITPIDQYAASITAAKPRIPFSITGNFIVFLSGGEAVDISLNDGSALFPLFVNGRYRMPPGEVFTKFEIRRRATAALATNDVVMLVGVGDYDSGAVALAATARLTSANRLLGYPSFGALSGNTMSVIGANADRRCVRIKNEGTQTAWFSTSSADVSGGLGQRIDPGETGEFFVTGEIFGRCNTANLSGYVSEERY